MEMLKEDLVYYGICGRSGKRIYLTKDYLQSEWPSVIQDKELGVDFEFTSVTVLPSRLSHSVYSSAAEYSEIKGSP